MNDFLKYLYCIADIEELDIGIIITDQLNKIKYANKIAKQFNGIIEKDIYNYFESENLIFDKDNVNSWMTLKNGNNFFLVKDINICIKKINYKIFFIHAVEKLISKLPALSLYKYSQKEIQSIIDCIHDGIFITDGNGNILMLNKASEAFNLTLNTKDYIGKSVREFVDNGYWSESVSLNVLKEKEIVTGMQTIENTRELLTTGIPYFEKGKVTKVITTERDVTELISLRKQLQESAKLTEKYHSELEYYRAQNAVVEDIVYKSKDMKKLIDYAFKVAKQDITVLIQGESGTGKEVIAKFIYKNSSRKEGPFIKINCGAIPENLIESELFGYEKGAFTGANSKGKMGLFELANKGTLFLDEVGELPLHLQVKILRAIQEREILRVGGSNYIPVDIRIIAATNKDLKENVKEGFFRKDLYYRLNVVPLTIKSLRERREDIKPLGMHFINIFNKKYGINKKIDENAWKIMEKYNWPGNVRELENIIERIIVTADETVIKVHQIINQFSDIEIEDMKYNNSNYISLKDEVSQFERKLILKKMPNYNSTKELADALNVDKSTIIRKMHKYKIKNIYID